MKSLFLSLLLSAALAWSQPARAPQPAAASPNDAEATALREALAEAGNSPVEFTRALERHLEKYPQSTQRPDLERALVKLAMENNDDERIIRYGERALQRAPDDLPVLERVTKAQLRKADPQLAERALAHAQRFAQAVKTIQPEPGSSARTQAEMKLEVTRALSRASLYQAQALSLMDKAATALVPVQQSYELYATPDAARLWGQLLARTGQSDQAVAHYADAFALDEAQSSERAQDRQTIRALWLAHHPSEAGLGDLTLQAYDRTATLLAKRREQAAAVNPNSQATSALSYTLSGVTGSSLPLRSLQGKVLVMDFWATWCGPCRVQHPLYEEVKKHFQNRPEVVFLAVNADDDRSAVKPFLEAQHWNNQVWYEDGLSRFLQVTSLPTTLIFDKKGEISSRLNGFVPERFVAMLSERIEEALKR